MVSILTDSPISDASLSEGVLARRVLALLVDACVIALIGGMLALLLAPIGLLTFGLGWGLYALMPVVPFLYHFATLASFGATPGQHLMGLSVRSIDGLGPPSVAQALVSTLGFYATLAFSGGILLLVAFATTGRRTLHDIAAGVRVVRDRRLPSP